MQQQAGGVKVGGGPAGKCSSKLAALMWTARRLLDALH